MQCDFHFIESFVTMGNSAIPSVLEFKNPAQPVISSPTLPAEIIVLSNPDHTHG
jgi:hypothetical protein